MKFKENTVKPLDYTKLKEGQVAEATLSSFNYGKDYCFATFISENKSVRAIIGLKSEYPIQTMLPLKGLTVSIEYAGTSVSNAVTYPKFYINF